MGCRLGVSQTHYTCDAGMRVRAHSLCHAMTTPLPPYLSALVLLYHGRSLPLYVLYIRIFWAQNMHSSKARNPNSTPSILADGIRWGSPTSLLPTSSANSMTASTITSEKRFYACVQALLRPLQRPPRRLTSATPCALPLTDPKS